MPLGGGGGAVAAAGADLSRPRRLGQQRLFRCDIHRAARNGRYGGHRVACECCELLAHPPHIGSDGGSGGTRCRPAPRPGRPPPDGASRSIMSVCWTFAGGNPKRGATPPRWHHWRQRRRKRRQHPQRMRRRARAVTMGEHIRHRSGGGRPRGKGAAEVPAAGAAATDATTAGRARQQQHTQEPQGNGLCVGGRETAKQTDRIKEAQCLGGRGQPVQWNAGARNGGAPSPGGTARWGTRPASGHLQHYSEGGRERVHRRDCGEQVYQLYRCINCGGSGRPPCVHRASCLPAITRLLPRLGRCAILKRRPRRQHVRHPPPGSQHPHRCGDRVGQMGRRPRTHHPHRRSGKRVRQ